MCHELFVVYCLLFVLLESKCKWNWIWIELEWILVASCCSRAGLCRSRITFGIGFELYWGGFGLSYVGVQQDYDGAELGLELDVV